MKLISSDYDLAAVTWRKSSYSDGSGGNCLEVCRRPPRPRPRPRLQGHRRPGARVPDRRLGRLRRRTSSAAERTACGFPGGRAPPGSRAIRSVRADQLA